MHTRAAYESLAVMPDLSTRKLPRYSKIYGEMTRLTSELVIIRFFLLKLFIIYFWVVLAVSLDTLLAVYAYGLEYATDWK